MLPLLFFNEDIQIRGGYPSFLSNKFGVPIKAEHVSNPPAKRNWFGR